MAKKKSLTHPVQPPAKDKNFVGVISPLEIHLKTRRPAVRPGQVMQSGKIRIRTRAHLKRDLRERSREEGA